MRTGTTQIVTVAPWFDITNSHQKYWVRTHRWKPSGQLSESLPDPFLAFVDLQAMYGRYVVGPRIPSDDPSEVMRIPIGL